MNIKTGNNIEKRINKRSIAVIILIVLLLGVLTIAAVWINQNDKNEEEPNEAIQQMVAADFKVISTDYFTIKVPAGWSATTEIDEYALLLNLNDETGAPAGSVQMLSLGATLYPAMDSDLYKKVIHRDEKNGQTAIITVLYTDQVDEHNANIITDIMKDSLENTAVFVTDKTTTKKVPSDEEVKIAYQQAVEAYSWFDLTTMPVDGNSEIEYGGRFYQKVNHSNIHSYADLETYLHSIFSDDIVDSLLENKRYIDIDGVLYAIPADRGTNIFAGEQHHEIIHENDKKIIYKVSVDILEDNLEKVVDEEVYSFAYEFSDKENRWLFTNFSLVW